MRETTTTYSLPLTEREKTAIQKALAALDGLTLIEAFRVALDLQHHVEDQRRALWKKVVEPTQFSAADAVQEL
ncbi:MAG: hypothetical protein A2486_07200 [Burkholderiales bacterium RIFOXYC12_FULL_65_23]|uniref:hypothetical protein n=1 Tax=Malikia spinosa TaxID=86180 RepID=UPI0008D4B78B|nr:MAG: hypothetical protein A2486_07200 [Burkholderiales bacterium RIFOXYC12_FULL_65_23]